MGCVCCCLNVRDPEDINSNGSTDTRSGCICLNSLINTIFTKYESLFREHQINTLPCNNPDPGQVDVSSTSDNITNSPRTLQLDPNSELQRHVIVEKSGAALSMMEQQQLSNSGYISLEHVKGELIQKCLLDSSLKSSEDEDVCPTCLEEYTSENPRTVMECSHHYHLSCIFEWMERSATCPVCGKVMMFVETS